MDAVLIPRVTQEALAKCFAEDMKATYNGRQVFEALDRIADEENKTAYDVIMTWEIAVINQTGMTFDQWLDLPWPERVQRVAANNLPKITEALALAEKLEKN
jgi:hypothetical protein